MVKYVLCEDLLDNGQKPEKFRLSTELLRFRELKSECQLANIDTRDETRVYYNNSRLSMSPSLDVAGHLVLDRLSE
jgi:hypothetical protein